MKFEELTKRIVEENLGEYAAIKIGNMIGGFNSINIARKPDGTFVVRFHDERGEVIREYRNIPEEEACQMVYDAAVGEKKFQLAKAENEKKNNGPGVAL